MKTVKVRKFKKEGTLLVKDTDGRLLTFLGDTVHDMTELFFQRPLGLSLLCTNELELCESMSLERLQQSEVSQVQADDTEIKAEEVQPVVESEQVAESVVESAEPEQQETSEVIAEKPKHSNKKNNKKESGG